MREIERFKQVTYMQSRMVGMEMGHERFQTIIDASKKASQRGDHSQAERLLRSSLKQAEREMAIVEDALGEIMESLASVYEMQGRKQDAEVLRQRMPRRRGNSMDNLIHLNEDGIV